MATKHKIKIADFRAPDRVFQYKFKQGDTVFNLKQNIASEEGFIDPSKIKLYLQCLELDDQCEINEIVDYGDFYILFPKFATIKYDLETYIFWKTKFGTQRWLKLMPGRTDRFEIPKNGKFAVIRNR